MESQQEEGEEHFKETIRKDIEEVGEEAQGTSNRNPHGACISHSFSHGMRRTYRTARTYLTR